MMAKMQGGTGDLEPSEATSFEPPLTDRELVDTEREVTIDPAREERDQGGNVMVACALLSIVALVALLIVNMLQPASFWASSFGWIACIGGVGLLGAVIYRERLPKPVTTKRRFTVKTVKETMASVAAQRLVASENAGALCELLNAEPFSVPAWAQLTEWSWSIGPTRTMLANTEFKAVITASNDHGRTLTREVVVWEDTHSKRADVYQHNFRKHVFGELCKELDKIATELLIAAPKAPEKSRYGY